MFEAALAVIGYIAILFVICRAMRANGSDEDADKAADSVRQSLDADSRFDELHSYTHPHVRAFTEPK